MCGFSGFISKGCQNIDSFENICRDMLEQIAHRGPDDSGIWSSQKYGVVLGHRRLSIQDTSHSGHQPMISSSGRYVVVYNGEIYNFKKIKDELKSLGCIFSSHSDTEVLLESIEVWGIKKAVRKFAGMFAFALWDNKKHELLLARDRIGEKPLYYGWQGGSLLFGSELKALKSHADWSGEISRNSLALYMRYGYIPTPYSIYCNIYKLSPGSIVKFSVTSPYFHVNKLPEPFFYWRVKDVVEKSVINPLSLSDEEVIESLDMLLREVVRERMISDVPLGAFLSGGVDSSAIVALMQQESDNPVKTFSIGFHDKGYNEADYAKNVADYLGTDHTEMYVTSEQALSVIDKLAELYDEPFADSSQIPTYLVSKMTKEHVTVALSGDGGDELFAGYNRYFLVESLWSKLSRIPFFLRSMISSSLFFLSPRSWDKVGGMIGVFVPSLRDRTGDKIHKLSSILPVQSLEEMYQKLISHWKNPCNVVLNSEEPPIPITDSQNWASIDNFTQRMQFLDTVSYLPDDILVKVDRASMGVSLETRMPFLDHKVFEFAWRVPMHQKIRKRGGKWVLKQVLYRYVPQAIVDRPKMGFGIPIDIWLRGPLREWADNLLNEERLQQQGFYDPKMVRKRWDEHLSGKRNWQYLLWNVLVFQLWLEKQNT